MTDRNCTIHNPPKQAKRKKQKYTTESFINRASEKHSGYYKYDRVVCNNALDKVEIYCPSCDAYFIQQAAAHLYGQGCGLCARDRAANSKRRTTNDFIELANKVHGVGRYDYSGVKYTLSTKNVDIKCNLCQLVFSQKANGHLTGQGCAHCAGCKRLTTEQFVVKAELVHGLADYDYGEVDYINAFTKVVISCKDHGDFSIRPNCVLNGRGCPTCGRDRMKTPRLKFSTFLKRSHIKHNSRYTYEASSYINTDSMVLIHCESHGSFRQRAADHMAGHGCKRCNMNLNGFGRSNFVDMCDKNSHGNGILYVIKCYEGSEVFYKIGVTSRTIKQRYNANFPYRYSVVYEVVEDGGYIYDLENKIHALLKDHHYSPEIGFKGSVYECFTHITKPVEKLLKQLESTEQLQLLA